MSIQEMIDAFSLERINPKAVAFDEKKLQWMNGQHIHRSDDKFLADQMVKGLETIEIKTSSFSEDYILAVVKLLKSRAHFLTDLPSMASYFFTTPKTFDEKAKSKNWGAGSRAIAQSVRNALEPLTEFNSTSIEQAFHALTESSGLRLGDLVGAVRLAVSGVSAGPGLWETFELLGKENVLSRIQDAEPLMEP